ncbi:MAG: hypothetical protein NC344_02445 [Bacteroidales bacterium]|nr:hypothetical protein [Bacteroidales bacterium]MCM1146691.1 hypothetical protein [Bacteroidales bacterium]MCM1205508.1 hypothetical protein [Bacillota bacterium]MCM1509231.1 hypothetical protein [Clostridium sp.]
MSEKIFSVDASGVSRFATAAMAERLYAEVRNKKITCQNRLQLLQKMCDTAILCEQAGLLSEAFDLYDTIVRRGMADYRDNQASEAGRLALEAYRAAGRFCGSSDECLWEKSSQLLSDARRYFEPASE